MPYARNARLHPPEQIDQISNSIKEFGFVNPCLVDADGVLVAGHGRALAAKQLGMVVVPIIRLGHLTKAQAMALRLADNKIQLNSAWDDRMLRLELGELKALDFDLSLTGFPALEIVSFTTTPDTSGAVPPQATLTERFGIVPFSVLNAREGWWQNRKRAWVSIGIKSEVGRGENLIGRSPQELLCHLTGIKYDDARKIVTDAMAAQGDAFDLEALVKRHMPKGRRRPNATPGGAPMPLDRAKDAARKAMARG